MSRLSTFILAGSLTLASAGFVSAHPHNDQDETKKTERSWPYFGGSDSAKSDSDKADSDEEMTASEFAQKMEERISRHADKLEKSMEKMDRKMTVKKFSGDKDDIADNLRDAGRELESALSDSGMISGLADMLADLAEDFEVEDDGDGAKVFKFDGKKMGHFKFDSEKSEAGRLMIGGLGKNLNIDRETYVKDGKTKTRIVIEMDGGEDLEIDVPELESKAKKKVRIRKELE